MIQSQLDVKGGKLYSCYVDLSYAFGTVPHIRLCKKLIDFGLPLKFVRLVQFIYCNTTAVIRTEDGYTDPFPIQRSILQGETLSPQLWNIYVNDLSEEMSQCRIPGIKFWNKITNYVIKIHILLFADDIVLVAKNKYYLQQK